MRIRHAGSAAFDLRRNLHGSPGGASVTSLLRGAVGKDLYGLAGLKREDKEALKKMLLENEFGAGAEEVVVEEATTTEELLSFPPAEHHIKLVKFAKEFNKIFSDSPRAFIRRNFTRHAAKEFRNQFLDFVFIDASHDYDSVLEDIKIWAPKVRKGGLISGHDINDPEVKKAVDEVFKNYKIGPDNIWYLYKK